MGVFQSWLKGLIFAIEGYRNDAREKLKEDKRLRKLEAQIEQLKRNAEYEKKNPPPPLRYDVTDFWRAGIGCYIKMAGEECWERIGIVQKGNFFVSENREEIYILEVNDFSLSNLCNGLIASRSIKNERTDERSINVVHSNNRSLSGLIKIMESVSPDVPAFRLNEDSLALTSENESVVFIEDKDYAIESLYRGFIRTIPCGPNRIETHDRIRIKCTLAARENKKLIHPGTVDDFHRCDVIIFFSRGNFTHQTVRYGRNVRIRLMESNIICDEYSSMNIELKFDGKSEFGFMNTITGG